MTQLPRNHQRILLRQDHSLPFAPETDLERAIMSDPEWRRGVEWGVPRRGHPEGPVKYHIKEVLANVDRLAASSACREPLRLIALLHDSYKDQVDRSRPRTGPNHHGAIARQRAARYSIPHDLLEIIELHDEAFNAYRGGVRTGDWHRAEERARRLLARLGAAADLYTLFFRCDSEAGAKDLHACDWFCALVVGRRRRQWRQTAAAIIRQAIRARNAF